MALRRSSLPFVLAALVAAPALAQPTPGPVPKRPKLGALADTNDARAYLDFGHRVIEAAPNEAAAAFYWAARIDPGLADAYYGRRVATLLGSEVLLRKYMAGFDSAKEFRALDSLQLRAVTLNPFLYRRLDVMLLTTYVRQDVEGSARRAGGTQPLRSEIEHMIDRWLASSGSYMRGWMAYGRGNYTAALDHYADAMKRQKEKSGLHIERGRIFGMRGDADSAIAELRLALAALRSKESKDVVVLYNSKAVLEQAIGVLLEGKDDVAGAREAYGRALEEDLSYWPAHVRLGMLAVSAKDTATAVSELTLAAQIAPNDPYVHHLVGTALALIGRSVDALATLKKSTELEPYFAAPHVVLGRMYESAGFDEEAVASYRAFLARASRTDVQREFAEQKLAALAKGPAR